MLCRTFKRVSFIDRQGKLTWDEASEGRRLAEGVLRGRGAGTTVSFCRPAWPQLTALWGSGADRILLAPTLSRLLWRVTPRLAVARAAGAWPCCRRSGASPTAKRRGSVG